MTEKHLSYFEGRQVYPICPCCRETKSPALLWFAVWSVGSKCGSIFELNLLSGKITRREAQQILQNEIGPWNVTPNPPRAPLPSTWRLADSIGYIFVKREGFLPAEDAKICKMISTFIIMLGLLLSGRAFFKEFTLVYLLGPEQYIRQYFMSSNIGRYILPM